MVDTCHAALPNCTLLVGKPAGGVQALILSADLRSSVTICSHAQEILPADGLGDGTTTQIVSCQQMFEEYAHNRCLSNWKFWIVSFFVLRQNQHEHFNANVANVFKN